MSDKPAQDSRLSHAVPFITGAAAGFGLVALHMDEMVRLLGDTATLMMAGGGLMAAFLCLVGRVKLSMAQTALVAATLGTAMTVATTMTDDTRADGVVPAERPTIEREGPRRFAPTVGSLEPGAAPRAPAFAHG
ncbi:MAG: hypothetical protein AAF677_18300 [Pseudomonadota bacterium]